MCNEEERRLSKKVKRKRNKGYPYKIGGKTRTYKNNNFKNTNIPKE